MSFLRKLLGKKVADSARIGATGEKEYVICKNCGAGYNTQMVASSILLKSPFMEDMASWTTRVTCRNCGKEIGVAGSFRTVFGQPRPTK